MNGRTFRKRKTRYNLPNHSETSSQNNQSHYQICKWMSEKGYKSLKKLKPKIFPGCGRGLMAKQSINSGDIIIAIPGNLLVTCSLVLQSELGAFIKKYYPNASGHEMLSLFLMVERNKGKASEWHPYIKTLPESYDIPAFYGNECLSDLPPYISLPAAKQVQTVENSFQSLKKLLKVLKANFPGSYDFSMFKWAWCAVNTRCVFIDCFSKHCVGKMCKLHLALAPFLDLLNHSVDAQVKAGFNRKTNHYEIVSLCKYKKYSQIFINYGPHDNCSLFIEYGFCLPNNSNDTISFCLGKDALMPI